MQPPANLDVFEQNQKLGRGINLGNALEAPNEGDWGVVLQADFFSLIKQAGFNSVRIPIRWSAHTTATFPYSIDTRFLKRVDWAIDQAFSQNLAVIINIHHFEEIMQDPAGQKARFLAIWAELAAHYQNYSGDLFFEILNEPNDALTSELWNQYLAEAIALIRETNPGRTLIVGTAEWGGLHGLSALQLPDDDTNIIVSFHYYNPFEFTHQGAEWVNNSDAWLGTQWLGTDSEKQAVINDFSHAVNWANANNRPLNVGEFGAYSKAAMSSRANWTAFVARTAEANKMSWHYWEFISGFGAYNMSTDDWNYPLLNALIPAN
ncbi:MAG: glycoside hydrolase family 5 protein [Calditrichaeota bacterium]|nr:MAG: glycoside hydrolase family 5 protein [Calditrichota bacterium]